jgi:hypothetical protein
MRSRKPASILLALVLAMTAFIQSASAAPGDIIRVSVASDGTQATSASTISFRAISANGRYVAFSSSASNLVSGDTGGYRDVFLRDTQTGITTRVSVDSNGVEGNRGSDYASLSADGRYVVFSSTATNLVSGDTNNRDDIFLHDTQTGNTTRVSVDSNGVEANDHASNASLSADGRYVVFSSTATNLVSGDTNGYRDVFLHDTETGITTCISNAPNGDPGNEFSGSPRISSDGNHIVFTSYASNLGPVDNNNRPDIYLYDIQTGIHSLISISSDGIQSNQYSYVGNISGDGRFIAFTSDASNLVSGDTNNKRDVFLHDTQTGTTTRVNVSSSGQQTTWGITQNTPSLSDDGRFVTFDSQAGNLASDGPGSTTYYDIFLRDTLAGTTTLISASSAGVRANSHSNNPVISGNGLFIAFDSGANNLIAGDTNNSRDVFIHEIPISIKIDRAGQNPTNAMEVHFDLLFTRPMVDVDAADFSLTTSGALSGASVTEVSGSGSLYTVTVSTGTGDGTLRLDVPAATAMTDEYGNLPNGLPLNGPEYVIDKTPPAVTSINRSSAETTNSASVNFVITFSESVTNVDALDFGLVTSGSVSGALITNVSGSGNTRTVTVNTGTGDGSLRLDLIDNDSVVDLAGNALGGNGEGNGDFDTGEGYTLIKSMPVTTVRLSEPFQRFRTSNPTPTFLWNNVSVLEWYEIVISTNRSFTNIVLQQTVTSTTFTPASPLADGVYYWRVRHFNSGFSAARYFIIDTTPPAVPTLTSPRNNAVLSATPNFRWTRVAGAALFEFRYDDDSDCASPIYTYSSRSNFRKPPAMPAGTYYWCVRAQDAAGNWSSLSAPGVITISP